MSGAILLPVMDPYNPAGSSRFVDMHTSKDLLWTTRADRCHVNLVVCDSEWERGFCEAIENAPDRGARTRCVRDQDHGAAAGAKPHQRIAGRRESLDAVVHNTPDIAEHDVMVAC